MRWIHIVRARNAEKYIGKCLRSIVSQAEHDQRIVIVLDAPEDKTSDVVFHQDAPWGGMRGVLVNERRLGVAASLWRGIGAVRDLLPHDGETIITIIDGDDRLLGDALDIVAREYRDPDCWITHGSYLKASTKKRSKISQAYPPGADPIRHPWRASHLKTFRASLLPTIKEGWFKDTEGKWLPAASDLALMLPLMQAVGMEHVRHVHRPIYLYRDNTPHKTKRALQKECEAYLRARWAKR